MKKKKLIRQSEFAKQVGISRQRVSWLVKKGTIPVTKDGLIDSVKAKNILEDNKKVSINIRNYKYRTYTDARAANESFKAKMAELEYKENEKQLSNMKWGNSTYSYREKRVNNP